MAKRVVIALGGNAILKPNQPATVETQLANIQLSAEQIAKIEKLDHQIVRDARQWSASRQYFTTK